MYNCYLLDFRGVIDQISKSKFSEEKKREIMIEANKINNNCIITRKYDVNEKTIRNWRKK